MLRLKIALLLWVFIALPARAEIPANIVKLAEAMSMPAIIDIMRNEGMEYGSELATEMFPQRAGADWERVVEEVYDREWMSDTSMQGFAEALAGVETDAITGFFESELGRRITTLELSARRALMDEAIEEASKDHVAGMISAHDPRVDLLQEYIAINNLVELNVVGALNSNLAFYNGLVDGGAFPEPIAESDILADVWGQEPEIRDDTEEWLYLYMALAYQPLSDDELNAYIALSGTPEGQALNQALFTGFDRMFNSISRELGLAAAQMMVGEDL